MAHAITRSHISYVNTSRMWNAQIFVVSGTYPLEILDDTVFIDDNRKQLI